MVVESAISEKIIATNLKQFVLVLSVSLSVATLPQVFSWFRQIPYTLLLVIVGLGLAFADVRLIDLSPGLILLIFLPPLLFEAAWNLKWSELKRDLLPISLYAVLGVAISIVGVAACVNQFTGFELTAALLIGASLSATDPVSVTALFRELGVSSRLGTLIEGESLFNDGMAVVAFGFLVGLPLGSANLEFQQIVVELFKVVSIGVAIGALVGFGISYLTQRFDLPQVEQSLTLISAYGTYLIAEENGGSGVIGVVVVGLILGNFGSRIGMNPRTRIIVSEFWEFISFFVNSIVFLLIGDQVRFTSLAASLPTIAVTVGAMVLTRAIATFSLSGLSNVLASSSISIGEQTILWWGGLRGSVSVALALSIPAIFPEREDIITTVFGVVLFTLLVQGLTVKPLLSKLKLLGDQPLHKQYLEAIARLTALNRVLQHLHQSEKRPDVEPEFYNYQKTLICVEIIRLQEKVEKLLDEYPNLSKFSTEQLREELLSIEADTYADLVKKGKLNQELSPLLQELFYDCDKKLAEKDLLLPEI